MSTIHDSRSGFARLARRIQDLTLEVAELRMQSGPEPELHAKEQTLEELRWRLVTLVRRTAANELDAPWRSPPQSARDRLASAG